VSRRRPPGHRELTICADPNCPEFATDHGRCKNHRRDVVGTGSRGSTSASRKRRQTVLDKAKDRNGIPCCFYCSAEADRADHFVPVAAGGADSIENMVAACTPCNGHKGKRMPADFMASNWLARRCEEVAAAKTQHHPFVNNR
jgi:5-methylcytosine-specific restriction endonuclease McrA